ncbi:hypothetical protein K443DRAFT_551331 [Laccaria amethystina LaAM-08-1]|uniref:Uncharacterized protein n=1 Tax=Laccaria amethystina LaAM-08-1 TaxID=1095629 RepID=A0A0C9X9V5_9AGAR|nr:hypothetical protein K443DRAFT_551331 [Laccaria amethystina LaAM-08-1]
MHRSPGSLQRCGRVCAHLAVLVLHPHILEQARRARLIRRRVRVTPGPRVQECPHLCLCHYICILVVGSSLLLHGGSSPSINTPRTTYPPPSAYPLNSLSLDKTLDSSKERLRDRMVRGGCWGWGWHSEMEGKGKLELGLEDDFAQGEEGEHSLDILHPRSSSST